MTKSEQTKIPEIDKPISLQKLLEERNKSKQARWDVKLPCGIIYNNEVYKDIVIGPIDGRLRKKIAELSVGEHTDVNPAPSGFQIIKLVEEKKGGLKPFEEIRDAIYSKLFMEKVEKRYTTWLNELRKKSFIKVTF